MTYTTILTEVQEKVGLITLNRPDAMNALNSTLMVELMDALRGFDADENIGAIVIAGSERVFAAGADISEMSCDMIVASEKAKFGQPEINLGVIPGAGGTQRLTHAVGKAIAMEMVLNARNLSAQEALEFGLVNYVVPVEEYLDKVLSCIVAVGERGFSGPWPSR